MGFFLQAAPLFYQEELALKMPLAKLALKSVYVSQVVLFGDTC